MKVLLVSRSRALGGMRRYAADLADSCARAGMDVRHVFPERRIGILALPLRVLLSARCAGTIHFCDASLLPLAALVRLLHPGAWITATAHGLDLLYPARWYQWLIRHTFHSPLPPFPHPPSPTGFGWAGKEGRGEEAKHMSGIRRGFHCRLFAIDRFVCVSRATEQVLRGKGVETARITVIPPALACPAAFLRESEKRKKGGARSCSGPVLLSVGRLIPRKGVAWFIESVFPRLLEQRPEAQFIVVGDGPERARMERIIREKMLQNNIQLKGCISDEDRDAFYAQADIFVMPNVAVKNDMEGFGIVCIEAAARGVPVAAARLEGLTDAVIEGKTGSFFAPGDAEDCLRCIGHLLQDAPDPEDIAAEALERFRRDRLIRRYAEEVFAPRSRTGVCSWDFGGGRGGLGRAMQWMAEAIPDTRVASPFANAPFLRLTRTIGRNVLFSLLLPFALKRWATRNRVVRLVVPCGPGGVFLLRKSPCPVSVVCYHTYAQQAARVPGQGWKRIFVPLERRTLRMADRVLCYSADTVSGLVAAYGVPQERICLLPQIFDGAAWEAGGAARKEEGLCVCVARLDTRKGVRVLLRAWAEVQKRRADAKLVLVGSGGKSRKVDREVARLGPSVRRIGCLDREDLVALVQSADVAVCPSYLEGFGLAAAEAMAAGTAVVASSADGLRALVVHERTGLLFPPGDHRALAQAIARSLTDGRLREKMRVQARETVRRRFDRREAERQLLETIGILV